MPQGVPLSASFAFDVAVHALTEQLGRIDSLDSKAGILLAADGVLAGLIFAREGPLVEAPLGLALVVGASVLVSLASTLISFANRGYIATPRPKTVAHLAAAPEDWIKWRLVGNVLRAVETDRARLRNKATWLTLGQAALLVTLLSLGSYFLQEFVRRA
jgi:hypothetical protein